MNTSSDGAGKLLRGNAPFRRFWIGETASLLGSKVTGLALPLTAVLILHATAAQMGYLTALELVPYLILALPVGIWLDRKGHRLHKMMAADLGRTFLLLVIPVLYLFGVIAWAPLYLVVAFIGSLDVIFSLGYPSLVTAVVPPKHYLAANTLVQGSRATVQLIGPALAGALIQLLSAPLALVADAVSFVASFVGLNTIHPIEPLGTPMGTHDLTKGLRFLWESAPVRMMLLGLSTVNLFNYMFVALLILYVTRSLHVRPETLGLILSVGAGGTILGALTASLIVRTLGSNISSRHCPVYYPTDSHPSRIGAPSSHFSHASPGRVDLGLWCDGP